MFRNSDMARYVAVCDLDRVRLADAKETIESEYAKRFGGEKYARLATYGDYREMLEDKSIDAVAISTPDHWHAQPAIEAALAGKDIYLQKPASLTIQEGRQMADAVKRTGRIFQQGSQQRSDPQFRLACELVRNGRIGKVKEVYIGLPTDRPGGSTKEMPVPSNLNYEVWLGSTPMVYYTEDRVHPQAPSAGSRYDRPGWLRCEQFGAGMITGWGAHHVDTAHWGMGTELTGPVEIEAMALFPKQGLWDVHGPYHIRARYADGTDMYISDKYPNGIKFLGEERLDLDHARKLQCRGHASTQRERQCGAGQTVGPGHRCQRSPLDQGWHQRRRDSLARKSPERSPPGLVDQHQNAQGTRGSSRSRPPLMYGLPDRPDGDAYEPASLLGSGEGTFHASRRRGSERVALA